VYLATLEKEIAFDQSMPDCEEYRQLKFTHIIDDDGDEVLAQSDYKDGYCLESEDTGESEDQYAGSDHDEYTGNEGAMSRFRYKSSVLLLVPPRRTLEFRMSHSNKLAVALSMFDDIGAINSTDEDTLHELEEICQVVLRAAKPKNYWHKPESALAQERRKCLDRVAQASLEHGWLHYLDKVLYEQSHEPAHLQGYAEYVSKHDVNIREDSLWKRSGVTVSTKYQTLGDITLSFNDSTSTDLQKTKFSNCYREALESILASQLRAEDGDGAALAKLVETCGVDVFTTVTSILRNIGVTTVANFVLAFQGHHDDESRLKIRRYQTAALSVFWPQFVFWLDLRDDLLCDLLRLNVQLDAFPMQPTLKQICNALPSVAKWVKPGQMWIVSEKVGRPYTSEEDQLTDYLAQVIIPFLGSLVWS